MRFYFFILNKAISIPVTFRECIMGEIQNENQCKMCPKGSYSFNSSDYVCSECFTNARCIGKNVTEVVSGYWRKDPLSTKLY